MPKKPIDYSKSCIYKIVCKDSNIDDFYIGSTTNLTNRKYKHKQSVCNETNKEYFCYKANFIRDCGGWENWEVIVLENCQDITNAEELRKKERYYFDNMKPTLNTLKPYLSPEELKQYNIDNNKKNRPIYYQKNRDKILLKKKKKFTCECGGKYTHANKSIHLKTKKHKKYLDSLN